MSEKNQKEISPLQFHWSFWEGLQDEKKNMHSADAWKNLLRNVATFGNVGDFWHFFRGIPKPSGVFYDSKLREKRPVGTDQDSRVLESLSLFKAGVEPSWEDAANIRGGEWWMRKAVTPAVLDNWWTNIVLGLVGCTIENSDDICGVRVVDKSKAGDGRTFVKIELWLRTKDSATRNALLEKLCASMADGDTYKADELKREFQWKVHGV